MQKLDFLVNGITPVYAALGEFDETKIQEDVAIVIDGKGHYVFNRNRVWSSLTSLDKPIEGANVQGSQIRFFGKKIPHKLIRQAEKFFRDVFRRQHSEAVLVLYNNISTGEWMLDAPEQTPVGLSAPYNQIPEIPGWRQAGTIHSHANIGASHSGVDDRDEEYFDGVHITIGNVDSYSMTYSYSLVAHGKRAKVEANHVVDIEPEEEYPPHWMERVKKPQAHWTPWDKIGFNSSPHHQGHWKKKERSDERVEHQYNHRRAEDTRDTRTSRGVEDTPENQAYIEWLREHNIHG